MSASSRFFAEFFISSYSYSSFYTVAKVTELVRGRAKIWPHLFPPLWFSSARQQFWTSACHRTTEGPAQADTGRPQSSGSGDRGQDPRNFILNKLPHDTRAASAHALNPKPLTGLTAELNYHSMYHLFREAISFLSRFSKSGTSKLQPRDQIRPTACFASKVLLSHGHTHSFTYCLCFHTSTSQLGYLQQETVCPTKSKIFIAWLFTEIFAKPGSIPPPCSLRPQHTPL